MHSLAYALVVLFWEAVREVSEVATASVSTLRQRLWKVGAVVRVSARRVWLQVAAAWPHRQLWQRVWAAVQGVVSRLGSWPGGPMASEYLAGEARGQDRRPRGGSVPGHGMQLPRPSADSPTRPVRVRGPSRG